MIQNVQIENYKSIQKLKLDLGRVTILIGENGSGKSNILEAIALSSAAANDKLDNEFLVSRGIRVTDPRFMRAAFDKENVAQEIKISLQDARDTDYHFVLQNDNGSYSGWVDKGADKRVEHTFDDTGQVVDFIRFELGSELGVVKIEIVGKKDPKYIVKLIGPAYLDQFFIYSPENSALRIFEKEGQIQPLGINGEGLFKLLKVLSSDENKEKLTEIKERLQLIEWFKDFQIPNDLFEGERHLQIKDKFLDPDLAYFDQKSSNEGFLFLLFYFALFVSQDTPNFFAIDNIDASLNPKLCSRLITELVDLAKKYDKQVIFTTHNPAVLDGLNLDDDNQRLLVIYRNKLGHTRTKRIFKPETLAGQTPVKLSEAFLRGYIGGLPKNF